MHRHAFYLLMSCVVLSGCDLVYGVRRDAKIDIEPPRECINRVIQNVPGITEVKYSASHEGKGLLHPTPWVYTYLYSGTRESHIIGTLQIYKEYDGALKYSDTLLAMYTRPPQADVDATRTAMRKIEDGLAAQCRIVNLPAQVKESCMGVKCVSL